MLLSILSFILGVVFAGQATFEIDGVAAVPDHGFKTNHIQPQSAIENVKSGARQYTSVIAPEHYKLHFEGKTPDGQDVLSFRGRVTGFRKEEAISGVGQVMEGKFYVYGQKFGPKYMLYHFKGHIPPTICKRGLANACVRAGQAVASAVQRVAGNSAVRGGVTGALETTGRVLGGPELAAAGFLYDQYGLYKDAQKVMSKPTSQWHAPKHTKAE